MFYYNDYSLAEAQTIMNSSNIVELAIYAWYNNAARYNDAASAEYEVNICSVGYEYSPQSGLQCSGSYKDQYSGPGHAGYPLKQYR